MNAFWLSRYGLLEDFTANVTGVGTGTTEVTSIALELCAVEGTAVELISIVSSTLLHTPITWVVFVV